MDDYDDTNDEDDSCYEDDDGNSNTEDDDDDNDCNINTDSEEEDKNYGSGQEPVSICWESMIVNQLATVVMRVWRVYHTIDGNLMKREKKQNHQNWTNFQAYMYILLKLSDEQDKYTMDPR